MAQCTLATTLVFTEFEERSSQVSYARTRNELDNLVVDLQGPGAIVTSAADRVELRGWAGSLKRHGEWTVPSRLALVRRMGSVELNLVKARFAGPVVVIELDMRCGSVEIRLPEGASRSNGVRLGEDQRTAPVAAARSRTCLTLDLIVRLAPSKREVPPPQAAYGLHRRHGQL
jgi:hypothetical protein